MIEIRHQEQTYRVPFAELFRPLSAGEEAELRGSIDLLGVQYPAFTYDSPTWGPDCVIDGANRLRIAEERHTNMIVQKLTVTDEAARRMAEDLNIARRQITPEEARRARSARIERVVAARAEGRSLRAIAAEEGVSVVQVRRDLESTVPGGTVDAPERVTGLDGRNRPATWSVPGLVADWEAELEEPEPEEPEPEEPELEEPEPEEPEPEEPEQWKGSPPEQTPIARTGSHNGPPEPRLSNSFIATPAPRVRSRKRKVPAHLRPDHPFKELLQDFVKLAGKIARAVNDSDPDSRLRAYLLACKLVIPRAKIVNGRNYDWQCTGLRGWYRVLDLAGKPGKILSRDQVRKFYDEASSVEATPNALSSGSPSSSVQGSAGELPPVAPSSLSESPTHSEESSRSGHLKPPS